MNKFITLILIIGVGAIATVSYFGNKDLQGKLIGLKDELSILSIVDIDGEPILGARTSPGFFRRSNATVRLANSGDTLRINVTGSTQCLTVNTNGDISGVGAACGTAFDATTIDAVTWSDGANASNVWTFDVSGTDTTLTFGNATVTLVGTFISDGLTLGANENLTLGAQTLDHDGTTFVFNDDVNVDGTASNSFDGSLNIAKGLTANSFQGGGLQICNATTGKLIWEGGQFACGTDAGSAGFDSTAVDDTTWSDNANATNTWTFDVSGTDHTAIFGSALTTWSGGITTTLDLIVNGQDITIGATGVKLTSDNDGAITFLSISAGSQEDFTINLDDTANTGVWSSSTGLNLMDWGSIGADYDSATVTFSTVAGAINAGGATSFEIPNGAGGTTVNTAGEVTINTTSSSLNFHDGTAERVLRSELCDIHFSSDALTATDQWGGVRFFDPITITKISPVASGTGSVGWRLLHGVFGTVTTSVFTEEKGASSSAAPIYTSFANASLGVNAILDIAISSTSADLAEFAVNVCYRYDAP